MLMRFRLTLVLVACSLAALTAPLVASASDRMLIGFQDDPSLRWRSDRAFAFDEAKAVGAGIVRTTVYWSRIADTQPAQATNPFDPAYHFDDLDEFVRNAGTRGMEVMLTIWGTPSWANGGKGQNYAPTNVGDLQSFAQAVASRYSGRFPGYPFVRYFTVWNESNLGLFLSPQYGSNGKAVAPATYATLYRAAYAGIKAGNPRSLVGIGETSPRGRDHVLNHPGTQETESPGKFAQLLSEQKPALKFDAWSHHPYSQLGLSPVQKVRWPNVNLPQLDQFGRKIDEWFHRKNTPIWITEYGHETKPEEPKGVTYAQQAAYVKQAIDIAAGDPRVQMFLWFILRDDPTSAWHSGLLQQDNTPKPAFSVFSAEARRYDARNPRFNVKSGVVNPTVRVAAIELWSRDGTGAKVGLTVAAFDSRKTVGTSQPQSVLGYDGWVSFKAPIKNVQKGHVYSLTVDINDSSGIHLSRRIAIVGV
jgi:hypothetical protein